MIRLLREFASVGLLLWLSGSALPSPLAGQTNGDWGDDLFRPVFAAPREIASYFSVLSWDSPSLDTRVASMGVGDAFPLARWGAPDSSRAGDGAGSDKHTVGRVAIEFGVLAQFDLDGPSFDFVNADFFVGVPVSLRRGNFSLRGRFYHWSAHLGDEFLLSSGMDREEVSVEALELLLSHDLGPMRVVGGGITRVRRFPKALGTRIGRGGVELRPDRELFRAGAIGAVKAIAALDVRLTSVDGWAAGVSARAGFLVDPLGARGVDPDVGGGRRRWSLVFEIFDGPSPYGQFFRTELRTFGVGLHLH